MVTVGDVERTTLSGRMALGWGVVGLLSTLGEAIFRLTPLALEPVSLGMSAGQWSLYVGFVILNGYLEGYRGFQQRFAPRVAARALVLVRNPTLYRGLLAPLFLMALIDATRRRWITSWLLVGMIAVLVLGVRSLPQPWRGIVDAGVVVGLSWGTLSVAWELFAWWRGRVPSVDPELASSAVRDAAAASHSQPQNT